MHHVTYVRGREPWDYGKDLLICLCRDCHMERQIHDEEAQYEFARLCAQMGTWQVYELAKGIRLLMQSPMDVKLYDAYEALAEAHEKRVRR